MFNKKNIDNLDMLYSLYYSQLIRSKFSPTYVENRILEHHLESIKSYILTFLIEIRKKIDDEKNKYTESYLTWNTEYYKKDASDKEKILNDFENKIKDILPEHLLGFDLSKTDSVLDTLYPDILPKSQFREILRKQWELIKEKHD